MICCEFGNLGITVTLKCCARWYARHVYTFYNTTSGFDMMTSSNGNIFRVTGHLCGNSPHKGQWRGAFMLSLICVWINGRVNKREAGDLRCYRAHYDVSVMEISYSNLPRHTIWPFCQYKIIQAWYYRNFGISSTQWLLGILYHLWPPLSTWFDFNPSMDKLLHAW